jgi:hypothetical protein
MTLMSTLTVFSSLTSEPNSVSIFSHPPTLPIFLSRSEQDSYTTHSERSFGRDKEQRKYFPSGPNSAHMEGYFMPEYKH